MKMKLMKNKNICMQKNSWMVLVPKLQPIYVKGQQELRPFYM